jgi:hypothetical protein
MPLLVLAAIVDVQQNAVKATLVRQDAFDNGGGIRRGKRDIFDV